jgi:intergrase/recombinase
MNRVSHELILIAHKILAITCPSGWKPSSTGQTCTDGKGEYRKPEDGAKPGRLGEQEAHSLVHNRLNEHFKDKTKADVEKGLKSLLDTAKRQIGEAKTDTDKQKTRQLQEGLITYGEKHGIRLSSIAERVAKKLFVSNLKTRRCR